MAERRPKSDSVQKHEINEMISDLCSDNDDVSDAAVDRMAQLYSEGRLSFRAKGESLEVRVRNPVSRLIVITFGSIVLMILGGAACWLLRLGFDAIGLGKTGHLVLVIAFYRQIAKGFKETFGEELSQLDGILEWTVISIVFLAEFVFSAWFFWRVM